MTFALAVIWWHAGATRAGRLEVVDDRLTLSSREQTFAFTADSVESFGIDRTPSERLRGMPVLRVRLQDGQVLRIASMGGVGSLHALAAVVGGRHPAASGT